MKRGFYILIFFLFIGVACKKYPEGGILFQAKSKIIGTGSVESLFVNGIDSTATFKAHPNYCEYPIIFGYDNKTKVQAFYTECFSTYGGGSWSLRIIEENCQ